MVLQNKMSGCKICTAVGFWCFPRRKQAKEGIDSDAGTCQVRLRSSQSVEGKTTAAAG